jgi:hypothetical protein
VRPHSQTACFAADPSAIGESLRKALSEPQASQPFFFREQFGAGGAFAWSAPVLIFVCGSVRTLRIEVANLYREYKQYTAGINKRSLQPTTASTFTRVGSFCVRSGFTMPNG